MYETILYPTDGSETAEAALDHALELASQFDATLHVVYVLKTNEPPPYLDDPAAHGDPDTGGKSAVETAAHAAAEHGIEAVEAILRGPTADAILEYAEDKDVNLIVMGTHGRSGIDRLVIGSVSDEVTRKADVPVVVVGESTED